MKARTQRELRHGLVLGTNEYAGFASGYTDEEIREFVKAVYGWNGVRIVRTGGAVLCTPPSHTGRQRIDTRSMEER